VYWPVAYLFIRHPSHLNHDYLLARNNKVTPSENCRCRPPLRNSGTRKYRSAERLGRYFRAKDFTNRIIRHCLRQLWARDLITDDDSPATDDRFAVCSDYE